MRYHEDEKKVSSIAKRNSGHDDEDGGSERNALILRSLEHSRGKVSHLATLLYFATEELGEGCPVTHRTTPARLVSRMKRCNDALSSSTGAVMITAATAVTKTLPWYR